MKSSHEPRRKQTIREARHVRLYQTMTSTAAWRSLNCYARAGYVELSNRYGGPKSNNGRVPYSVREMAENLGVGKATAQKVFVDLQDRGFIVQTRRGRYGRRRTYASEWRLTEFACDVTGEAPTHAYRHWKGQARPISNHDFLNRARASEAVA